jgi:hypothetical protein
MIEYLSRTTTKEKDKKMTVANKTYQVGDLFTTQKSGITGTIVSIEPQTPNRTLVLLDVEGQERFTTVTL